MAFNVYADLCSLLAATIQNSVVIGQKIKLIGCHSGNDGNEMRNATCLATKTSKFPTEVNLLLFAILCDCARKRTQIEN